LLDIGRYVWDGSLEPLLEDIQFILPTEPRMCGAVDFWPGMEGLLVGQPCSSMMNFVVCEKTQVIPE